MADKQLRLLLAEDDPDDRMFFEEAITELTLPVELTSVEDGEELMKLLSKEHHEAYTVLFLDLNMPRKNGLECLKEILDSDKLRDLPVIILSTSKPGDLANSLYLKGVKYYIQKPGNFSLLKDAIEQALHYFQQGLVEQPPRDKFIIPH